MCSSFFVSHVVDSSADSFGSLALLFRGVRERRWKAEQEKQYSGWAIANSTGIRALPVITAAVRVRVLSRNTIRFLRDGIVTCKLSPGTSISELEMCQR